MKRYKIAVICISLIFILSSCNKKPDYIVRNIKWNISMQEVIRGEEKLKDTDEGYQYKDNVYMYSDAIMYELPCSIVYEFSDNDELEKLGFQFDATTENFELIKSALNEDYGESSFKESDDMETIYKWEIDNTLISLVFMDYESEYFSNHLLSVLYNYKE